MQMCNFSIPPRAGSRKLVIINAISISYHMSLYNNQRRTIQHSKPWNEYWALVLVAYNYNPCIRIFLAIQAFSQNIRIKVAFPKSISFCKEFSLFWKFLFSPSYLLFCLNLLKNMAVILSQCQAPQVYKLLSECSSNNELVVICYVVVQGYLSNLRIINSNSWCIFWICFMIW